MPPLSSKRAHQSHGGDIQHSTTRIPLASIRAMLRTLIPLALAMSVALLFPGCKDAAKQQRRDDLRALMHGNTDDADIRAAIEKAHATVGEFLAVVQKPAANQSHFMVRKAYPTREAGKQQILWFSQVTYDGALLHAVADDKTAVVGAGIPLDGRVSFPPGEICDWMFNEDGKAIGGFMLRALKAKMTEDEWAKIAERVIFKE